MNKSFPSTYPRFSPNQILTDTQLNQMQAFLDGQNRLTRTHGIGAGIVCGLEATHVYLEKCKEHVILIESGYGFSSDGYLIQLPESDPPGQEGSSNCHATLPDKPWKYTHVRPYAWKGVAQMENLYQNWKDGEVWELLSTESAIQHQQQNQLEELHERHLNNHALVLFSRTGIFRGEIMYKNRMWTY